MFGCHIETKSTYKIYDIDYTVLYNGKPINNKVLKAQKIFRGVHPEKAIDEYVKFLLSSLCQTNPKTFHDEVFTNLFKCSPMF